AWSARTRDRRCSGGRRLRITGGGGVPLGRTPPRPRRHRTGHPGGAVSAASEFQSCITAGGVVVFPADTVYGLACDPANRFAVERLYLVKRRPLEKPSAVMFFSLAVA